MRLDTDDFVARLGDRAAAFDDLCLMGTGAAIRMPGHETQTVLLSVQAVSRDRVSGREIWRR